MTLNDLIARDLDSDPEDALRREEAQAEARLANFQAIEADYQAERAADALAAAYDPTFACVVCSAVMAEPHRDGCTEPQGGHPYGAPCLDCPWCDPSVTGPAILALFTSAPKMKALWLPDLKISRAGANSSNPGGLWIASDGGWGESTYYGSIRADGTIRATKALAAEPELRELLKFLAALGTEAIRRIGLATGRCCYCGKLLTDDNSVTLGYGPVCAKYHNLPHGKAAAEAARQAAA
jgi:Family of unknown function (DUF6011)